MRSMVQNQVAPALLVSYAYLESFLRHRERIALRDWVMDSGAFSAHHSGTEITVQEYGDKCEELLAADPLLVEVFSLDVIGDWRGSRKNTEYLWKRGIRAIPTFHLGSPEDVLRGLAREYPKVALGGAVGQPGKLDWAAQCFARVWPHRLHGFGFGGQRAAMNLPWHSVDATNWELGPCMYGNWRTFGAMSVRGKATNLAREIDFYLELERKAKAKWAPVWEKLGAEFGEGPTVRLALSAPKSNDHRGAAMLVRSGFTRKGDSER